ncbi:putative Cyclic AMP receptor-like protein A [Glarea lozoyensis 74030]|uniref:Putative Cyclic AMP receptor-like protein A n=1 Tax=Glarea lozoyensis (strain ATCC 74030 / MF5533) TaxID=1104152 RepID=H0EWU4_GLAL7|nr:putative Cyclic AMP receptor-like protein A [Glarea lozoyensis 74030]
MKATTLSPQDLANFATIERVASSLSLVGIAFIVITYAASPSFHKPINRLVFYASAGNIFTNIATLMSRNFVHGGPMCQFQAFLIQMFMPADAYWTLAMACNVWLTFYRKYDKSQLRALEKYYILLCYGIPLVPALVFFAVKSESKGLLTLGIYLRAGKDIWVKRKQLRNFNNSSSNGETAIPDQKAFAFMDGIQRTTDISVNYEDITPVKSKFNSSQNSQEICYPQQPQPSTVNTFTVDITGAQAQQSPRNEYPEKSDSKSMASPTALPLPRPTIDRQPPRRYTAVEANTAIWSYTKVSLLFFLAMMVTWIPSSANRVYSVVNPSEISLGLAYTSALVLPLQGFWNATIYATTSLSACKELWANIKAGHPFADSNIRIPSFRRSKRSEQDVEHRDLVKRWIGGV